MATDFSRTYPLLPLRDAIVFPLTTRRILVGRDISLKALEYAEAHDNVIILAAQKNIELEELENPMLDLYSVGVMARMSNVTPFPNGCVKVVLEGEAVVDLRSMNMELGFLQVTVSAHTPAVLLTDKSSRFENVLVQFREYAMHRNITEGMVDALFTMDSHLNAFYGMIPFLQVSLSERQRLLEVGSIDELADNLIEIMQASAVNDTLMVKVQQNVRQKMAQQQKEWFISEQIRQLQDELDGENGQSEPDQLLKKIKEKKFAEPIREKLEEEIGRMKLMQPTSPEYAVSRNYLDWFLTLPYNVYTETSLNMKKVKAELDSKHFGLDKVKDRIMEYIAVLKLTGTERRAPILCLVGPPGVGKTTLVESIAKAMQRNFVRITLGGVRDEAEIRGHRRTYIGAMPGRFIQALKRAKCMNPIILLDEIDKMASDFRGDPASAMLEVLDPEQNHDFTDHFMEVGLDLSRVLFIATANNEGEIPEPLRDRMEVVRLPGYFPHEKEKIAANYLVPRICERTGVTLDKDIAFNEDVIRHAIRGWTREAGVRELERVLERIVRHRAKDMVTGKKFKAELSEKTLQEYLGAARFLDSQLPESGRPGVITGLAWTSVGGEILPIECTLLQGKGGLLLTGKLGDVMKESAQIALSLVRERLQNFGIDPDVVKNTDIHIHVPEGAVPKDGPSAGIALTLCLLSAFTRHPVPTDIAFTGEVSLTGACLPIGGLNEKALAALQAGVKTLRLPEQNKKDVDELPAPAKKGLKIFTHKHIDEIIKILFKGVDKSKCFKVVTKEGSADGKKN
ncbi:ATP-dependent proteinase. Serine peptidase. MEROPS family S16 [Fibrobacter sp. UWH9]|uniref:endopeptidase La n=1 Tax=Fibrobacter sp. UWH9 TaxID=1896213 RepID=UPI0009166D0C|nr:endopeptidase La [Fibrobacter sp. UWH9]SHH10129.1 ATP-dependent proteinase. Serine peptidase. MEROPS family S16 [Fibrobacter sp. UWH9]